MAESSLKEKKTLWEQEKLLVTSNFSFSHSVFERLVLQTRKNQGLFGKGLKMLTIVFHRVGNIVGNREIDIGYQYFLFLPHCFRECSVWNI